MNLFLAVLAISSSLATAKTTFARQGVEDEDPATLRPPGIQPKEGEIEASEGTTPSLVMPRGKRARNFSKVSVTPKRETFSAESRSLLNCGDSVSMVPGTTYTIQSPNYPANYPPNERCLNTFLLSELSDVYFVCDNFDVLCNKNLRGDFLDLDLDNGAFVQRFCNRNYQPGDAYVITTSSAIDTFFRSNRKNEATGYQCEFTLLSGSTTPAPPTTAATTTAAPVTTAEPTTTVAPVTTDPPTTPAPTTPSPNELCNICGEDAGSRIVGGTNAVQGSIPWQVGLQTSGGFNYCGGTLVGKRTVITAAHCVTGDRPRDVYIWLGGHRVSTSSRTRIVAASIVIHESYDRRSMQNDVAIITLSSDVTFDNDIRPACLPKNVASDLANIAATISGWGTLEYQGSSPDTLQTASVTTTTRSQCDSAYGGQYYHTEMICAAAPGTDSCQGDSGGPLTAQTPNDRTYLLGIVSWGYGCADSQYPGVYARTPNYEDWIAARIGGDACFVDPV